MEGARGTGGTSEGRRVWGVGRGKKYHNPSGGGGGVPRATLSTAKEGKDIERKERII